MPLLLLAAAAVFGVIFLLNNLIKAIFGARRVTFWEIWLAFLTAILIAVALILNYLELIPAAASGGTAPTAPLTAPDPLIDQLALIGGGGLAAISLVIALIELLRPPRLARSRGVLGIFTGLLILLSGFGIPFAAAYLSVRDLPAPDAVADAATPGSATAAPAPTLRPGLTPDPAATEAVDTEAVNRFRDLFDAVREVLADEIAADEVAIFTELDAGVPLAQIIEANGGDVRQVVRRISEILQQGLRDSIARGDTNALQGALIISQMDTFVMLAVNSNLTEMGGRFNGPTPTGTRPSLLTLLTTTAIPGGDTTAATVTAPPPTSTAIPTETPSPQPTRTPLPTEARTLPPTITPRPPLDATDAPTSSPAPLSLDSTPLSTTPQPGSTSAEPTPQPTQPAAQMTCLATTAFNLRLRAEPSAEAETLDTIPFSTPITLSYRTSDSSWWQTEYNGQVGWVDGEFLLLGAACPALLVR